MAIDNSCEHSWVEATWVFTCCLVRYPEADYLVTGDRHIDDVTHPPVLRSSIFLELPILRAPT
jgi:hypothetical protein